MALTREGNGTQTKDADSPRRATNENQTGSIFTKTDSVKISKPPFAGSFRFAGPVAQIYVARTLKQKERDTHCPTAWPSAARAQLYYRLALQSVTYRATSTFLVSPAEVTLFSGSSVPSLH